MSGSRHHGHGHHQHGHDDGAAHVACAMHTAPHAPSPALRERNAAVRRVFWVTLFLNFAVAGGKGVYAWLSGSIPLGADAFHSVLDGTANVLALVGLHYSTSGPDAGHPYGHRKFEILAALGIGVLISVSLAEVASAAAGSLMNRRPPPQIGWPGFAVVLASMGVNFFVARYEARKGRELDSPLLTADAHHTESDLYASGAVLLSFVAARIGWWWADGVTALILVFMVGRVAWEVFRENVPSLLDTAVLDPRGIRDVGCKVAGVLGIHGVRSRGSKWAVELDLHMQVPGEMKVDDAHALAHRVEDALRSAMPQLMDVVVHIEPLFAGSPSTVRNEPTDTDKDHCKNR